MMSKDLRFVSFTFLDMAITGTVYEEDDVNYSEFQLGTAQWDHENPEYLIEMAQTPSYPWLAKRPLKGDPVPQDVLDALEDDIREAAYDSLL